MLFTARTLEVSAFNKKLPYQSILPATISAGKHAMDVVLFNEAARKIFLEHLPANTINERFGEVVLAVAFEKKIRVFDMTPMGGSGRFVSCSVCNQAEADVSLERSAVFADERSGGRFRFVSRNS